MTENYSKEPFSIAELRSEKEGDAKLWTVRDALISLLRDIDSGEINPNAIVMFYRTDTEKTFKTNYTCAGLNFHEIFGLIEICKHRLLEE